MWNVGPNARREKGDDACMGFMGLLTVGGAHAPGWVRTIGEASHPAGNHCSGESGPTNWHATRILKLEILARDGPAIKNFKGVGRLELPSPTL